MKMKRTGFNMKRCAWVVSMAAVACGAVAADLAKPAEAGMGQPEAAKASGKLRQGDKVTLAFVNLEIEAIAKAMGAMAGKIVIVDPKVKGTLTLASEGPVGMDAAFGMFLAELRLRGFAAVDSGGMYKIVPESDAKLQGLPVGVGDRPERVGQGGGQMATQIFKLSNESAGSMVAVLRPLIGPNNTITASPGGNALVVTDYAENLARIGKIIAALDVQASSDVEFVKLNHAVAADAATMLSKLMEGGPAAGAQEAPKMSIAPESRTNSVVIKTQSAARMALAKQLLGKIDEPSAGPTGAEGNIHVVYLKNAEAGKLAGILRAAIAPTGSGSGGSAPSQAVQTPANLGASSSGAAGGGGPTLSTFSTASASTGGGIQADPATNALIISAPEPVYRQLRAVIDKLDARRAQVYVESLIVEVNASKASELGVQWQGILGKSGDANGLALGTNFGSGGNNLLALSGAIANGTPSAAGLPGAGLNIGIAHNFAGVYGLGLLARFMENNMDANVLSTPNLLTLDNEEAKIVIGQNVPFVTGQFTSAGAGANGTVNPFQTIERKDVGLTLRVRPQISQDGTVKLAVFQEVSSVSAASGASGLVTDKRSIESTVVVDDGAVVVLGGLLQEQNTKGRDKVPVLGDLPGVGGLFRTDTASRQKTNLMVFLRPVVVRDRQALEELSGGKYEAMRSARDLAGAPPMPIAPDMKGATK